MYCYHCGYRSNKDKIEAKNPSLATGEVEIDENATVSYVCPRCGHLIHEGMTLEDSKELSRASHAQVQRGSNSFATGMCLNSIGIILLIVSFVFLLLSKKPSVGFVYNCGEFYVCIATFVISVILLGFGIYKTIYGVITKNHYSKLLKDLNNQTFVQ